MPKDYYVILGISRGANLTQIKHAYRKIAKQSHPDLSRTPSADEFLEIKEAYETLADAEKRRKYDADLIKTHVPIHITQYPEMVIQRRSVFDETDQFESVLDDFFEGFVPGFFEKERFRSPKKELYYEIILTPREARDGGLFPLKVPVMEACPRCMKSGIWEDFFCPVCFGNGRIQSEREFSINIPANVQNGVQQRIPLGDIGLKDSFLNITVTIDSSRGYEDW